MEARKQYIRDEQAGLALLARLISPVLTQKTVHATGDTRRGCFFFSVNHAPHAAHQTADQKHPGNVTRAIGDYTEIWEGFVWLQTFEHLEQCPIVPATGDGNHRDVQSSGHFRDSDWPSTDWSPCPGVSWVAPNETQWLWHKSLAVASP